VKNIGEIIYCMLEITLKPQFIPFEKAGTAKNCRKKLEYISPKCFHLYRGENGIGDRSAEEHLKNSKITIDAYLGLGLAVYLKNFW
jgi:hypothetical protein